MLNLSRSPTKAGFEEMCRLGARARASGSPAAPHIEKVFSRFFKDEYETLKNRFADDSGLRGQAKAAVLEMKEQYMKEAGITERDAGEVEIEGEPGHTINVKWMHSEAEEKANKNMHLKVFPSMTAPILALALAAILLERGVASAPAVISGLVGVSAGLYAYGLHWLRETGKLRREARKAFEGLESVIEFQNEALRMIEGVWRQDISRAFKR